MNKKGEAALLLVKKMYQNLPEFIGVDISDINKKGIFGDAPIHVACTRGDLDVLSTLVEAGADVNSLGEHGYTPLHQAVAQGHLDLVRHLLQSGADPSIRNEGGDTPYELSTYFDRKEVSELLKQWVKSC